MSATDTDRKLILNAGSFTVLFTSTPECRVLNMDIIDCSQTAKERNCEFQQTDLTKGIPLPDRSCDCVYASHFLEHLTREEGRVFLKEAKRVMKDEGYIRLLVPDTFALCKDYVEGKSLRAIHGVHNVDAKAAPDESAALFHLLCFNHKTCYDETALVQLLKEEGFEAKRQEYGKFESELLSKYTKDLFPEISLIVEGKFARVTIAKEPERSAVGQTEPKSVQWKDPLEGMGTVIGRGIQQAAQKKELHKIAVISTPFFTLVPKFYSGTEMIVSLVAQTLAEMNYDVTVFAPDGSDIKRCKMYPFGEPINTVGVDWLVEEKKRYEKYKDELHKFDIIHESNWFGTAYLSKLPQILHVHSGGLNWQSKPPGYQKPNLVAISKFMQSIYAQQGWTAKIVHNGIDVDQFKLRKERGDRLLFVGRLSKLKRPDICIAAARMAGIPIDLVGGTFVEDPQYVKQIEALCGRPEARLIKNAPHDLKITLMQNAKAVLISSCFGEPFNMVAAEANAAGAPVICSNDGALREVVEDGVTGIVLPYIQHDLEKRAMTVQPDDVVIKMFADAIKQVHNIRPEACRERTERLFTRQQMTKNLVSLYEEILKGNYW